MGVGIIGIGKKTADNIVTNAALCELLDTTNEWIVERSGIHERPVATSQKSLDLAIPAAREALAGIDYDSIDLVIVCTVTPDMLVPSMGSLIKMELDLKNAVVFDLNSACSGFVYGLWTAESIMLASRERPGRTIHRALLVGAERISRMANWEDRASCVLFGDGTGCVVVEYREGETGIIACHVKNYDDVNHTLWCPLKYEENPFSAEEVREKTALTMIGKQVFKFAVLAIEEAMLQALEYAGLTADEVDFYVPHQANYRIIKSAAQRLGQPLSKFLINIGTTGNISAASIPIALRDAVEEGKVKKGDTIMVVGFGGGLSSGAALLKMW